MILAVAETSLPATNQEQMYVGASRAVERMTLYTDNKEAVRAAVPRSSLKKAALDLRPDQRKARDQTRKANKQRQRRLSLITKVRAAWDASPPRQNQPDRQAERQVSYGR